MTQTTKTAPAETQNPVPPAILDGILAGHIAHEIEEVTISAKKSPTKKDEKRRFDAYYALDVEGMAILCGGKLEAATPAPAEGKDERSDEEKRSGACDHFNYGRILFVRQQERTKLEQSIEGPEKNINRLTKQLVTGGMFDTEAEARDHVIGQLKKKGQLDANYSYPGASTDADENENE